MILTFAGCGVGGWLHFGPDVKGNVLASFPHRQFPKTMDFLLIFREIIEFLTLFMKMDRKSM